VDVEGGEGMNIGLGRKEICDRVIRYKGMVISTAQDRDVWIFDYDINTDCYNILLKEEYKTVDDAKAWIDKRREESEQKIIIQLASGSVFSLYPSSDDFSEVFDRLRECMSLDKPFGYGGMMAQGDIPTIREMVFNPRHIEHITVIR
jgi:hypothetical protein